MWLLSMDCEVMYCCMQWVMITKTNRGHMFVAPGNEKQSMPAG